jgi:beta-lactamase superfamily II metal-dependent hydrolase
VSPAAKPKIRVRMYSVGFGDCFLIAIPGDPVRTVLVDAGFHAQGKGAFSGAELADRVIADAETLSGKKRVDVVVATHRHQDHVFAFNSPRWDELDVGEIWLPWVENRKDPTAVSLWKKKTAFAAALAEALPGFGLSADERAEVEWYLWNAGVGPGPAGFAAWSNQGALDRLHEGFPKRDRVEPRFLPTKDALPDTFTTDVLPGVKVHVLGPPRNPDEIEELDPVKDGESYRTLALRALEALSGAGAVESPFADAWLAPPLDPPPLEPDEEQRVQDLARTGDALAAAHALDHMINSTSLALVLEIGSARLLLTGDAEWSTWKRVLADADASLLLKGTTFLKVSHHGSHNGTPVTLVKEILPASATAMVSTQEGGGNFRNDIPLRDLLTGLKDNGVVVVRSDKPPATLPKGFTKDAQKRWIDLQIPFEP